MVQSTGYMEVTAFNDSDEPIPQDSLRLYWYHEI